MERTNKTFKKVYKIIILLLVITGIFSILLFFPWIRNLIISFGEKIAGRILTHEVWHSRIIKWEIKFLIIDFILIIFFLYLFLSKNLIFYQTTDYIFNIKNEINILKKSKSNMLTILLVFILLIGIRCFYINQKKSLHVDEALSISICNRNEYGFWGKKYELNHEYTGAELRLISLWDNSSIRDSLDDVIQMHKYNRDTPHTNFYYSLFRLWFTGVKTNKLTYIYWRGCLLNLVFFIFSFIFMFLLIRRFTDDNITTAFCLLIAFFNPASISLTIFLRPYELQQTFVIILTYYVTCILIAKSNNLIIETKRNFINGVIVLALTMLSAYFNFILIGFYGLVIIIYCIGKKEDNLLKFFILMFISGLLLAKLLYFDFGNMDYRGAEAGSNLNISNILINIFAEINGIKEVIFKNLFFMISCMFYFSASLLTIFNKKNNKKSNTLPLVIIINFVSFISILYFAPLDMKYLRYVAPLFPIFSLSFIDCFHRKNLNYLLSISTCLLVVISLIPISKNSIVEHIDDSEIENYSEIQNTELPIFIRGNSQWMYGSLIPYLNDDNKVIFINDFSEINNKYSQIMPCIYINQIDGCEEFNFNSNSFLIKKLKTIKYYDIYYLNSISQK